MTDRSQDARLIARHKAWNTIQALSAHILAQGGTLAGYMSFYPNENHHAIEATWKRDLVELGEWVAMFRELSGTAQKVS